MLARVWNSLPFFLALSHSATKYNIRHSLEKSPWNLEQQRHYFSMPSFMVCLARTTSSTLNLVANERESDREVENVISRRRNNFLKCREKSFSATTSHDAKAFFIFPQRNTMSVCFWCCLWYYDARVRGDDERGWVCGSVMMIVLLFYPVIIIVFVLYTGMQ